MTHDDVLADIENWRVPKSIAAAIGRFLIERKTGNVAIHVKDGIIMGARLEEIVSGSGK